MTQCTLKALLILLMTVHNHWHRPTMKPVDILLAKSMKNLFSLNITCDIFQKSHQFSALTELALLMAL